MSVITKLFNKNCPPAQSARRRAPGCDPCESSCDCDIFEVIRVACADLPPSGTAFLTFDRVNCVARVDTLENHGVYGVAAGPDVTDAENPNSIVVTNLGGVWYVAFNNANYKFVPIDAGAPDKFLLSDALSNGVWQDAAYVQSLFVPAWTALPFDALTWSPSNWRYRTELGRVWLRGGAAKLVPAVSGQVGTMPTGFRPLETTHLVVGGDSGSGPVDVRLRITGGAGLMIYSQPDGIPVTELFLDGASFPLD